MLDYLRMKSLLPGKYEFTMCSNNIDLNSLELALTKSYADRNIPVKFKYDKINNKAGNGMLAGMLSKSDTCLVVYNPEHLDYYVYVFVIRDVDGERMISYYSSNVTMSSLSAVNANAIKNGLLGKLKSSKQKDAEYSLYFTRSTKANADALIELGIYNKEDFNF